MPSDYLALAKAHLDYVQAKRAGLGGEPSCAKMIMEEAQIAVQIAQVEATERLAKAMAGVPISDQSLLPFEDGMDGRCVHRISFTETCEQCGAVADIGECVGECVGGGPDDGCDSCAAQADQETADCGMCIDDDTRTAHAAFDAAIAEGRLSRNRLTPVAHAGDYMYMGEYAGKAQFKHRDTRKYLD